MMLLRKGLTVPSSESIGDNFVMNQDEIDAMLSNLESITENQSAESNDSLISLSKNFKNIQEQIKNTQEHSRTMKNTQEQIKNTIAFRENISNLYNALGEESIWAAKRCQMGCLNLYPSPCIYTTRAALNKA
ncbi:hypothetical protein LXL04_034698 [Taraxacum kok-saghyz]